MLLGFFTDDAYQRLLDSVKQNKDKYLSNDNWVPSFFGQGVEWYGTSSQQVNRFIPYMSGSKDKSEDDLPNAINLHEAFKISPLQATNRNMWTYMCHIDDDCRRYMRYRWSDSSPEQGNKMLGSYFIVKTDIIILSILLTESRLKIRTTTEVVKKIRSLK